MKINIYKRKIGYNNNGLEFIADMLDLPGSPPLGNGRTAEEAVASLLLRILHPSSRSMWINCIDFSELSILYGDSI